MNKNKTGLENLSFSLDKSQSNNLSVGGELYTSTRSRFIELVEDKSVDIEFGSKINCQSLPWEFKCTLDWEQLEQTEFDDVRFCTLCDEKVYTAYSKAELKRLVSQGSCVRVITQSSKGMLGVINAPPYSEPLIPSEESFLVDAIIELVNQIEIFNKRRGYYPVSKLKRLLGRLDRFEQQIEYGLRDNFTGVGNQHGSLISGLLRFL